MRQRLCSAVSHAGRKEMWKKLTTIDASEYESELWLNDEARVACVRRIRTNVCMVVFEGGAEARVKGTPEEIIAALGGTVPDAATEVTQDGTTYILE